MTVSRTARSAATLLVAGLFCAVAAAAPIDAAQAAPPPLGYRVTPLVTTTGQLFTPSMTGNPVNDAGRVAGWTEPDFPGSGNRQAAVYYLGNQTMRVLRPPGSSFSMGMDINTSGQVTGVTSRPGGAEQAFVWTSRTNTYRVLGTLGGPSSIGFALNDHGVVVGESALPDYRSHAFVSDPEVDGGRMRDLGVLGGDTSRALGINDDGVVVGFSQDFGGPYRGFRWDPGTHRMVDIGSLPGDNSNLPRDVDDRGYIVGGSSTVAPPGDPTGFRAERAYVLSPDLRHYRVLPAPARDDSSVTATAINRHGVIVGTSNGQTQRALLWGSCGTPVQVLADHKGFTYASGINRYERILGADGSADVIWRRNGACG